jgi:hypothetical protein
MYYFIWSAVDTTPKTIDSHAFLYYRLTRMTRRRIHESGRSQTNNEQDSSAQLRNVPDRPNRIYLGMDRSLIVSASAAATTHLVRRHCDNLAPLAY